MFHVDVYNASNEIVESVELPHFIALMRYLASRNWRTYFYTIWRID